MTARNYFGIGAPSSPVLSLTFIAQGKIHGSSKGNWPFLKRSRKCLKDSAQRDVLSAQEHEELCLSGGVVYLGRKCWSRLRKWVQRHHLGVTGNPVPWPCGRREGHRVHFRTYTCMLVCALSIFLSCVHPQLWLVLIPSIPSITLTIISTPAASLLQPAAISITRSARGPLAHPSPIQTGPIPQVRYKSAGRFCF